MENISEFMNKTISNLLKCTMAQYYEKLASICPHKKTQPTHAQNFTKLCMLDFIGLNTVGFME